MTQIGENSYTRPEHIKISTNGEFEGTIKEIVFYGSFYEIILSTKDRDLLIHSYDDSLEIGQKVNFKFIEQILTF
jgi:iron(III) transport system ATP-binding protein